MEGFGDRGVHHGVGSESLTVGQPARVDAPTQTCDAVQGLSAVVDAEPDLGGLVVADAAPVGLGSESGDRGVRGRTATAEAGQDGAAGTGRGGARSLSGARRGRDCLQGVAPFLLESDHDPHRPAGPAFPTGRPRRRRAGPALRPAARRRRPAHGHPRHPRGKRRVVRRRRAHLGMTRSDRLEGTSHRERHRRLWTFWVSGPWWTGVTAP